MRKKIYELSLIITILMCAVGCGKKESDTVAKGEISISDLTVDNEIDDDVENFEKDVEENFDKQVILFGCKEEIRNADPENGYVQIDDMIFQYGSKVSDVIYTVNSSECDYTYYKNYNEDELVVSNNYVEIIFLKGDERYFKLLAKNATDETISLKDCIVTKISSYKASKGNVFYSGFNDESSNIVTYDYIKNIMKDYEIIQESTESESSSNLDIKQINLLYFVPSETSLSGYFRINFIFESDTGELKTFEIID